MSGGGREDSWQTGTQHRPQVVKHKQKAAFCVLPIFHWGRSYGAPSGRGKSWSDMTARVEKIEVAPNSTYSVAALDF